MWLQPSFFCIGDLQLAHGLELESSHKQFAASSYASLTPATSTSRRRDEEKKKSVMRSLENGYSFKTDHCTEGVVAKANVYSLLRYITNISQDAHPLQQSPPHKYSQTLSHTNRLIGYHQSALMCCLRL